MTFDVIIVGGSYAGISAGMQLARARRRVLVMDTGLRRNRFARASHGFLGQDGRDPAAIADDARAQLLAYPSVEWLSEAAVAAKKEADGFVVKAANGERFTARRVHHQVVGRVDPLHVGAELRLTTQVDGEVHAQAGQVLVGLGRRVHKLGKG